MQRILMEWRDLLWKGTVLVKCGLLPWVHQFRVFLEVPWVPEDPGVHYLLSHQGNHVHPKRGTADSQNEFWAIWISIFCNLGVL